ncbi:MAG: coproporphyrinogen III oxidase [Zetaproteobacteria bacterium]|nr:MAG: coproporphyrinogen III oxidase [Zetaproteobacteria bacterium]
MRRSGERQADMAFDLVVGLQARYHEGLEALRRAHRARPSFVCHFWLRDQGRHGGGWRWQSAENEIFASATINVSQVHYTDDPARPLLAASAISAIVHPAHPNAPSMHMHISHTMRKDGTHYWRWMADLNPAIPHEADTQAFRAALQAACPRWFKHAEREGARYFWIPALGRTRGVAHFYLEAFTTGDEAEDFATAWRIGRAAIDTYLEILERRLSAPPPDAAMLAAQRAYHTLYFFQVLMLDRGTTAGLLAHQDNDLGILGSLPPRVDRTLLASWRPRVHPEQRPLLDAILDALPQGTIVAVDDATKLRLAAALRGFYRAHPEALRLQARASVEPPTLLNHLGKAAANT